MFYLYLVENIENGKIYVGKTSLSVERRWNQHLIDSRHRKHGHFLAALRLYGAEKFKQHLLATADTEAGANILEIAFIHLLRSYNPAVGYNATFGGDGVLPTQETLAKISAASKGKKYSTERLIKMRGVWNRPEHRAKLSAALSGHNHPLFGKKRPVETVSRVVTAFKKAIQNPEIRQKFSAVKSGTRNPSYGKRGESAFHYGKPHSKETKERISRVKTEPFDLVLAQNLRAQGKYYREIGQIMGVGAVTAWKKLRGRRQ